VLGRLGDVAVVGLGRSGGAASRLLLREGASVYGSDAGRSEALDAEAASLRALGARVDLGGHDLELIGRASLVIVSPGVPPDAPAVATARARGIPIWAEAELGLRALGDSVPYVAITGTNGKTTTTALAAHLLGTAGRRAIAAGNIGTPLCEIALADRRPEVMAVELSSFQLHDMPTVRPTVGILTNLAPDHLDRYPSLEAYYRDKMALFANADGRSLWVLNADDPESLRWTAAVVGGRRTFGLAAPADGHFDRASGWLVIDRVRIARRAGLPLLGDHNAANALAAALAVQAFGVDADAIATGWATVAPLNHRLEPVAERFGVLWINDSKATNVASTEVALRAMDRPFVLLLGGRHKGEPYTKLGPLLGRCRVVIAYGEAGPLVVRDLEGVVPVESGGDFADVLARAKAAAKPGDAVLLSPACSSYDMFQNYEERGRRFRAAVEAM